MFGKSFPFVSRKAVISTLLAAVLSTSVFASQPPSTGLGESWPNATDVSVSPHYHAYVFIRDGIRYIQINDLNGTVRGAVAVADRVVLVLPVGVDAHYVSTQHASAQATPSAIDTSATETVYSDNTLQVTATPDSAGNIRLNVATAATCTNPLECTVGTVMSQVPTK